MEVRHNLILFTGIANNKPLKSFLGKKYNLVEIISFSDHHHYSKSDFEKIERIYNTLSKDNNCSIITTEKDMVKLKGTSLEALMLNLPLFYIPIDISFINDGAIFDSIVVNSIKRNQ